VACAADVTNGASAEKTFGRAFPAATERHEPVSSSTLAAAHKLISASWQVLTPGALERTPHVQQTPTIRVDTDT
jgi:hypothetical protein